MKIRTIYFKVSDMQKAVAFWQTLLGIEPHKKFPEWHEFITDNIRLGLLLHDSDDNYSGSNCVPVFEFDDDELMEIIQKPDEWSIYDLQLAIQILRQRGKRIDDKMVSDHRTKRSEELDKPRRVDPLLVIIGTVFALASGVFEFMYIGILPHLFIFLGIVLGFSIVAFKKQNPLTGKTHFYFSSSDRSWGRLMIVIECISLLISFSRFFIR